MVTTITLNCISSKFGRGSSTMRMNTHHFPIIGNDAVGVIAFGITHT